MTCLFLAPQSSQDSTLIWELGGREIRKRNFTTIFRTLRRARINKITIFRHFLLPKAGCPGQRSLRTMTRLSSCSNKLAEPGKKASGGGGGGGGWYPTPGRPIRGGNTMPGGGGCVRGSGLRVPAPAPPSAPCPCPSPCPTSCRLRPLLSGSAMITAQPFQDELIHVCRNDSSRQERGLYKWAVYNVLSGPTLPQLLHHIFAVRCFERQPSKPAWSG